MKFLTLKTREQVMDGQKIIDGLKEAVALNGWLPIASAPKDGSHVLLCKMEYGYQMYVGFYEKSQTVRNGVVISEHERWQCSTTSEIGSTVRPTHWMPLPEPPDV